MSGTAAQNFVNQYLPYAQQVSQQTGLPVNYILGQAGEETAWGTSPAAVSGNNFFGISPGGSLATYSSPAAGFAAYGDLINSRYSVDPSASPYDIASTLQAEGYASDPNYGSSVAGFTTQVDQVLGGTPGFSGGGSTGSMTTITVNPTTEQLDNTLGLDPNSVAGGVPGDPFTTYSPNLGGGAPYSGAPYGGDPSNPVAPGSSSSTPWGLIEEIAIRVLLVLVGLVLIAGALFIAGERSSHSAIRALTP